MSSAIEAPLQLGEAAMEPTLDRAGGMAEPLGQLLAAFTIEISRQDQRTLIGIEPVEAGAQRRHLLGRRSAGGVTHHVEIEIIVARAPARMLAPPQVDRHVSRDRR